MRIEKKYIVPLALEEVNDIFSNLNSYGHYHPLIKKVDRQINTSSLAKHYRIIEQPYKSAPIRIAYEAEVTSTENGLRYSISGLPLFHPTIDYRFQSLSEQSTEATFCLVIDGPNLGKSILQGKMVNAQDQLMNALSSDDFSLNMTQEKAAYVLAHYSKLMSLDEAAAWKHYSSTYKTAHSETSREEKDSRRRLLTKRGWCTSDPKILCLLEQGVDTFRRHTARRIAQDHPKDVHFNYCPKCQALTRTPLAQQCRHCHFAWHKTKTVQ